MGQGTKKWDWVYSYAIHRAVDCSSEPSGPSARAVSVWNNRFPLPNGNYLSLQMEPGAVSANCRFRENADSIFDSTLFSESLDEVIGKAGNSFSYRRFHRVQHNIGYRQHRQSAFRPKRRKVRRNVALDNGRNCQSGPDCVNNPRHTAADINNPVFDACLFQGFQDPCPEDAVFFKYGQGKAFILW